MYNVSSIFFNKCLYFSYYMAGYLLDRTCHIAFLLKLLSWEDALLDLPVWPVFLGPGLVWFNLSKG